MTICLASTLAMNRRHGHTHTHSLQLRTDRGVTLMEVIVASAIAALVIVPFGMMMAHLINRVNTASERMQVANDHLIAMHAVQLTLDDARTFAVRADGRRVEFTRHDHPDVVHYLELLDDGSGRVAYHDGNSARVLVSNVTDFDVRAGDVPAVIDFRLGVRTRHQQFTGRSQVFLPNHESHEGTER